MQRVVTVFIVVSTNIRRYQCTSQNLMGLAVSDCSKNCWMQFLKNHQCDEASNNIEISTIIKLIIIKLYSRDRRLVKKILLLLLRFLSTKRQNHQPYNNHLLIFKNLQSRHSLKKVMERSRRKLFLTTQQTSIYYSIYYSSDNHQ